MSKRNHRKDTSKLKNALAHSFAEGFGPMRNARHPRKVKLPQPPKSDSAVGFTGLERSNLMNSNTKDAVMRRNPEPQPYGPQEVSFGLAELAIFVTCLETRDQDGVRTVVYLRDREKVVSLDTCTDADLLAAAVDHLTRERDEISRTLEKAKKSCPALPTPNSSSRPRRATNYTRPTLIVWGGGKEVKYELRIA